MTGDTTASGPGSVAISGDLNNSSIHISLAEAAAPRHSPLHQLPSDIPDFTGREADLRTLLAALDRESGGAAAVTAIKGMGGIGKTTLAVHAARKLVARYPDAQILVNLQGHSEAPSLTPVEAMAQVVRAFNPQTPPADDPAQMLALYRSVLAGKRALILLDNAADATQVRDLVPPPPCGLIVTARDPIPLPGATRLELHELARPDSVALLRSAAAGRDDVTDAEWDTIASLCGDLPLALRVAGSFLAEAIDWTAAAYIRDLSDERTRPDRLTLDSLPDTGVAAVLGLSARRLAQSNPALAARWQELSVFPADFDQRAAAAVWRMEEDETKRTLTTLLGRSLLLFDADEWRYRLHDLMRPVAARVFAVAGITGSEPSSTMRTLQAWVKYCQHYTNLMIRIDKLIEEGNNSILSGLTLYDKDDHNFDATMTCASDLLDSNNFFCIVCISLTLSASTAMSLRKLPSVRVKWASIGIQASQKLSDREAEKRLLSCIGQAHAAAGYYDKAVEAFTRSAKIAQDLGDTGAHARRLSDIASTYTRMNMPKEALKTHMECLEIYRNSNDDKSVGIELSNIAAAHLKLDEAEKSIPFIEESINISRKLGDKIGECLRLSHLCSALILLSKYDIAIATINLTISLARSIGDKGVEALCLGNLGFCHSLVGNTNEAMSFYEKALEISREMEDKDGEARYLFAIGELLAQDGDTERAVILCHQGLSLTKQAGGRGITPDLHLLIAICHSAENKTSDAIYYAKLSLQGFTEIGSKKLEKSVRLISYLENNS
ncbi:tetratricopeptide repeat protein [Azospirillum sp.]|uniref:tetratricopeptide repeat protein n=1 Tax=Azospirillum sp. TaxID=34012 RepID=UPI002D5D90CF|nr:tetratricopeptide repeat protein [Azospirillum sp.]HYD68273.1 tetratricopeptide repeat protein [Azospirillum sp.]